MEPPPTPEEISQRMRQTLELAEAGFHMQRQNIRRQFPDATDNEIETKFLEWLHSFPPMSGVHLRVVTDPEPGGRFPPGGECQKEGLSRWG